MHLPTKTKWVAVGAVILAGVWGAATGPVLAADDAPPPLGTLSVDVGKPGAAISPTLFGVFFEEINHAGDGGLYGELLQNRSFENGWEHPGWQSATGGSWGTALLSVDTNNPLSAETPNSLRVNVVSVNKKETAGVANTGFWGVPIKANGKYRYSFYARSEARRYSGDLHIRLQGANGQVYAEQTVRGLENKWKKFSGELRTSSGIAFDPSAKFVILGTVKGVFWLDGASLFGETYKNRANGLRPDLAQMTADLKPAFIRFPGGCFVEGDYLANAFRWKTTLGEPALRPGHENLWGYRSSDGLGFHEYLLMCEDMKATPLFVVNCGMSHHDIVPLANLDGWIQDALDALDYANAPAETLWGKRRAENGHKAPFNLRYVEVGNENGGPAYAARFARFQSAIKARYPDVQIIVNNWGGVPKSAPYDLVDDHIYTNANDLAARATQYDNRDRNGAKVYVGEYAVTVGAGQGNLRAALGEAAYMTGLERNGDVIAMASYAPLFVNVHDRKWNPDAIVYDNSRAYGTPSYYVQKLFRANQGGTVLPVTLHDAPIAPPAPDLSGKVGVGTWKTQAEFRKIAVSVDGTPFAMNPDSASAAGVPVGWQALGAGKWRYAENVLTQTSASENVRAVSGIGFENTNYSVSVQARKTGGSEGFLILIAVKNDNTLFWWNVGGWNNTLSGVERFEDGGSEAVGPRVPTHIEPNKWYDVRVDVVGSHLRCFLDDKLIQDVDTAQTSAPQIHANATRDAKTGEIIVKVVNRAQTAQPLQITLSGASHIQSTGTETVLTSASPSDENSFDAPLKIAPQTRKINGITPTFTRTFAPNSLTILRFKADAAAKTGRR